MHVRNLLDSVSAGKLVLLQSSSRCCYGAGDGRLSVKRVLSTGVVELTLFCSWGRSRADTNHPPGFATISS